MLSNGAARMTKAPTNASRQNALSPEKARTVADRFDRRGTDRRAKSGADAPDEIGAADDRGGDGVVGDLSALLQRHLAKCRQRPQSRPHRGLHLGNSDKQVARSDERGRVARVVMCLTWAFGHAGAPSRACAARRVPSFHASARVRVRSALGADPNGSPLSPPRQRRATSPEGTRAARTPTASVRADHAKKVEGGSRGDNDQR